MEQDKKHTTYNSKIYLETTDFFLSGESFELVYDETFELLKTYPVPSDEDLPKYYESENYVSHQDSKKGLFGFAYSIIKKWSLKKKVKLITRLNSSHGSLLDIGTGTGDFLKAAQKDGWDVLGVEPIRVAREKIIEKGIPVVHDLDSLEGKFDVVTLWHALEHIHDIFSTIDRLGELVKPGGHLVVAVPNYNSYDAKHYGKYWAAWDVPRHIWHFSQESIGLLFKQRFELVEKRPLVFDAFYVSLLSHKYKTGRFGLKPFLVGLKSNLKAIRNNEYSSLIYCLKRKEKPF